MRSFNEHIAAEAAIPARRSRWPATASSLLARSYGKDVGPESSAKDVDDRTLFNMFSQTKVFTSATASGR
jgi:CubicO group peptidase (beta-lactamase class C family)